MERGGKYLLSGSVDKTAIVWDVSLVKDKDAEMSDREQQALRIRHGTSAAASFSSTLPNAPTLDVDWRTSDSLATSPTQIYVCKIGATLPVKTSAHTDEVNAISRTPRDLSRLLLGRLHRQGVDPIRGQAPALLQRPLEGDLHDQVDPQEAGEATAAGIRLL